MNMRKSHNKSLIEPEKVTEKIVGGNTILFTSTQGLMIEVQHDVFLNKE